MLSIYRRAMPPEQCASRILRAVAGGRREVLVGGVEVWSVYLKRLSPGVVAWLIRSHPVRLQRKVKRMLGLDRGTADSDESDA